MFLNRDIKRQRYYHHDDFRHSGSSFPENAGPEITTKESGGRKIQVVRRVLDVNERMAEQNRRMFAENGTFVLNVMSSPGSGKTTLLEKTLNRIVPEIRSAVVVGDICTTNDADRHMS